MELERLEVKLDFDISGVQEGVNQAMPKINGLLKRIEGITGRSGKKINDNLDLSDTTKKLESTLGEFTKKFQQQMDRIEDITKNKSTATARQMAAGMRQTRTSAGKEIDLMVDDMEAKMNQAFAAQAKVAELMNQRDSASGQGDVGGVVKYDEQIARAEQQMTSYRNKAIELARSMKAEFDAVPQSLEQIAQTMDFNESKIETMRANIANLQKQYEMQMKTVGGFGGDFSKEDTPESLKTMQSIQKQVGQINKLISSNDQLQQAYARTEDRASQLRAVIGRVNDVLSNSSIRTGNAALGMQNVTAMSQQAGSVWSRFGGLFNRTSNFIAHGAHRSKAAVKSFFTSFGKGSSNFTKQTSNMSRGTGMLGRTISRLANRILIYGLMYKGIMALSSGMMSALKTNQQFASSLNQIKVNLLTAFYPIYQAILPALNALMSAIARVTGYIASLIATLFGTTFSAAKQGASALYDNVKALEDTGAGASKAKDKVKELQRSLMGFDEINKLDINAGADDGSGGAAGSGAGGLDFGTPDYQTPEWLARFAENARNILSRLFEPVKNAWDQYGKQVMDAFKYALTEIWELTKSIGRSFMDVWTDGTGERIMGNIFQIVANLTTSVGNLARQFREAWETNGIGVSIFGSILGMIEDATGHLLNMAEATESWTESLDFSPLLNSVDTLLKVVRPLTDNIGAGLSWFYRNVLLPFGSWAIQEAVPSFLELLSSAIGLLDEVINALRPTFEWLWDTLLQPIAEWTGGVIVGVLDGLAGVLDRIGDFISEHQELFSNFVIAFGIFAAILSQGALIAKIGGLATGVIKFFGSIKSLSGGLALLKFGFGKLVTLLGGPWTIAIAAAIAIGVLLWKNWDTIKEKAIQIWNSLKDFFKKTTDSIATFFTNLWTSISKTFANVGGWFSNKFQAAKNGVTNAFSSIGSWFKGKYNEITNVFRNVGSWFGNKFREGMTGIRNAFSGIGSFFGNVWNTIVSRFSNVGTRIGSAVGGAFRTIMNNVLGTIERVINRFLNMLNGAIRLINKIPGVNLGSISLLSVPRLARGGILDRPTLAMVGEAGKEAVMPLENNTGWITDLAGKIKDRMKMDDLSSNLRMPAVFANDPTGQFGNTASRRDVGVGMSGMMQMLMSLLSEITSNEGGETEREIILKVDRSTLGDVVIKEINHRTKQSGKNPLDL